MKIVRTELEKKNEFSSKQKLREWQKDNVQDVYTSTQVEL